MSRTRETLFVFTMCCLIFSMVISLFAAQTSLPTSLLCPSEVNEGSLFLVTVLSGNESIPNATVTFAGETNLTNADGQAWFIAPRIMADEPITSTLSASKEGYNTTTCSVTIRNVPQLFPLVTSTYIPENTTFSVTVLDDQGRIIENATVIFEKKEYSTDENGTALLFTPLVRKSETYTIIVQKTGYLSNEIPIVVSPQPSLENILGVLFILGICFATIMGSILLLMRKYFKQKRINRK